MFHRGDIILYSGRGLIQTAIKRIIKGPFSHAAWCWDELHFLESDFELFGSKGVQVEHADVYHPKRIAVIRPKMSDNDIEGAIDIAISKIGQSYDLRLFADIGLRVLFGGKIIRNARFSWICSEIIAAPCYNISGFRFNDNIEVNEINPTHLWESVRLGKSTLKKRLGRWE